ncbi:MAG: deoxyribodipyrimidine photo-lyase, partial [Chitinophagaceae bacterium]
MQTVNIFWFRRDLRLYDNAGLYHALKGELPVIPIFIFDRNILDKLENKSDSRVEFIHQAVTGMQEQLRPKGSSLEVYYGYPADVFKQLLSKYKIGSVYTNGDYEPYARDRDESIAALLPQQGVQFQLFKDQVIFE